MPIVAHGREREHLRIHSMFEIQHQPSHPGSILADAHSGNVGVIGAYASDQFTQGRRQVDAFEIHHHTRRIRCCEVRGRQGRVKFQGHPGVIRRGPHPHADQGRTVYARQRHGQQHPGC